MFVNEWRLELCLLVPPTTLSYIFNRFTLSERDRTHTYGALQGCNEAYDASAQELYFCSLSSSAHRNCLPGSIRVGRARSAETWHWSRLLSNLETSLWYQKWLFCRHQDKGLVHSRHGLIYITKRSVINAVQKSTGTLVGGLSRKFSCTVRPSVRHRRASILLVLWVLLEDWRERKQPAFVMLNRPFQALTFLLNKE